MGQNYAGLIEVYALNFALRLLMLPDLAQRPMKALFTTAFICFSLLISALAQTEGEKTRLRIWHETARFVFADNGKPELANKLQSESKAAFEASIKADEEKVYSRLYKPLEESGSIY